MKKLATIVLAVLMLVSLCACGAKDDVYVVRVCQLTPHVALDAATQGFIDALTEALGEDKVDIEVEIGGGDTATCSPIVNAFVADDVDLIMANATPALQAAVAAVLVGYVPGAVHVRTGDAFTQGEAVEDNFRSGIFFFHTSLPFPYAPKYSLAVQP